MVVEELKKLQLHLKDLIQAQKELDRASEHRYTLGINATRAKITTANARLSTKAKYRDKMRDRFCDKYNLEF